MTSLEDFRQEMHQNNALIGEAKTEIEKKHKALQIIKREKYAELSRMRDDLVGLERVRVYLAGKIKSEEEEIKDLAKEA